MDRNGNEPPNLRIESSKLDQMHKEMGLSPGETDRRPDSPLKIVPIPVSQSRNIVQRSGIDSIHSRAKQLSNKISENLSLADGDYSNSRSALRTKSQFGTIDKGESLLRLKKLHILISWNINLSLS